MLFFISRHKLQNGSNLPRLTPTQSSPPLLFICIVMDFFAKMSCRLHSRPSISLFFLYMCSVAVMFLDTQCVGYERQTKNTYVSITTNYLHTCTYYLRYKVCTNLGKNTNWVIFTQISIISI